MKKIKIGISACLLGEKVRYDGGHKMDLLLKDSLEKYVEFVPVCPEVECGLGVPRKRMHLEGNPESPRLIVTDTGQDLTDLLLNWAEKRVIQMRKEDIRGFIFKSNSPSCGIRKVKFYSKENICVKAGVGIFAEMFVKHFQNVPIEDEVSLRNPGLCKNFIERVLAYAQSCSI
jgi:uncharacterized protein YbbK (DUF523 family)